ncbi:ergothioneine biosynthesis protein EgtB [Sphingomonas astaxanthinifaciens]|uniref:Ergothioneine biosynthesis protein EgtB n=1 Tax=Sphingomonas astaxanthinifaciens DSM 22298 TaxID=1123267 RepID=A0ABQ5Z7L9_9SPHN|nr:ergothioneine biosynthesis protein EgtB [Sphingomonas astaxanthinifaciens]GLR46582.1 ergothioneine biosynthesis protein EgtB [Sphingomonas astaxanthinifaciens DSM 22298]
MNAAAPVRQPGLAERVAEVRALTLALAAPLGDADATVQPMPDASPAKWHLAHTSWFFETFVLRDFVPGYRPYDERWGFLFNSYYNGEGKRLARDRRGMLARPHLDEIRAYRAHVDAALARAIPDLPAEALSLVELGIHHEQQHQELFLTDILASFAANPLEPAYGADKDAVSAGMPLTWHEGRAGEQEIGAGDDGFSFDSERPRHRVWLQPHAIASRTVTNGEWAEFIAAGGYSNPALWLSDGWDWVQREGITGPLYRDEDGTAFTLAGRRPLDPQAPVTHVSYYEADAFARWAGARLPTEAEWEAWAAGADPCAGHQLDRAGPVRPQGSDGPFGDVWCWTGSAFLPHPGFRQPEGTVGEYNGKFMSGQMVLKGASCATPRGHSRASYRNFFPPAARWQFTGVRLARDL